MKKQREMVLLEDSLHTMRSRFNSRFLALRAIKREILATVASDNRRLREIDAELGEGGNGEGENSTGFQGANQRFVEIVTDTANDCELQSGVHAGPFVRVRVLVPQLIQQHVFQKTPCHQHDGFSVLSWVDGTRSRARESPQDSPEMTTTVRCRRQSDAGQCRYRWCGFVDDLF